ncbi:MAG: recombinase family protein [Syntrophomonadaceae bacterium]|jgi:site-specific DNA recombinase|nr:recombinase family protein [Syntrophomonadaceae bacterium]
MLRLAAYCRVSEEEQVRGENIDAQKMEIANYLKYYTEPYTITWYLDDGISSQTYLNERPEGSKLMAAVMEERYDQVIIQRVDRLARDDLIAQVMYRLFKDHNIKLVSIHQNFDINTPEGQLMATTFSGFASYEYHVMRERLAAGRTKNAYKGKWNGGNVPYGYQRDDQGSFIVDPETSQNYTLIKNLLLQGHGAGYVRARLKELGILSPRGNPVWSKRTLIYMMRNPFYKGEMTYKDIRKKGNHPPLITPEEYNQIQQLINRRGHRGTGYPHHLLSGLIKCYCGKGFAIRYTGKNRVRRYCCQHKYETAFNCQAPLLDSDSLENSIVNIIISFASKPDAIQEAVGIANQFSNMQSNIRTKMKRVAALERKLKGVQRLIRKKDEMYIADIISDVQYEEEIASLYEQEKKLREEYSTSKEQLDQTAQKKSDHKKYIKVAQSLKKHWPQIESEAKQQAVRELIADIQMGKDQLVINFREFSLPLKPNLCSRGCWFFT